MADWVDAKWVGGDQWTLAYERDEVELAKQRSMAKLSYAQEGVSIDDLKFTCDDCPRRFRCKLVFDLYSTNGDCLWEK